MTVYSWGCIALTNLLKTSEHETRCGENNITRLISLGNEQVLLSGLLSLLCLHSQEKIWCRLYKHLLERLLNKITRLILCVTISDSWMWIPLFYGNSSIAFDVICNWEFHQTENWFFRNIIVCSVDKSFNFKKDKYQLNCPHDFCHSLLPDAFIKYHQFKTIYIFDIQNTMRMGFWPKNAKFSSNSVTAVDSIHGDPLLNKVVFIPDLITT